MHLSRPDLGQLTYCTNIHAAEHLPDVLAGLRSHLPAIKAAVSPGASFGVGLRLAASAAEALQDPAALEELIGVLEDNDCYVFTINGFPYGAFHGQKVKEEVYSPDWSTPERLTYSNRLAGILARLLPDGIDGTISTVPGTFKPWAKGRVEAMTENLVRHVAFLVDLHARTGKSIMLTLEPEPCCFLETIEETVAYFRDHLFAGGAVEKLAALTDLAGGGASSALRRHLGVCYDVCHAAVEYEDPAGSVAALRDAGIAIGKLQLSSALKIAQVDEQSPQQLRPCDEPVYLHQVIQKGAGGLTWFSDLPEALDQAAQSAGTEWRIHFHVPVFLDRLEHFGTTQDFLREILAIQRQKPISGHLEVETYTWDVLPGPLRNVGMSEAIARELNWVRNELGE